MNGFSYEDITISYLCAGNQGWPGKNDHSNCSFVAKHSVPYSKYLGSLFMVQSPPHLLVCELLT